MNLNATLIGQSITFLIFLWFCWKFIWPPIVNALAERRKEIADGLAAAEKGRHELELAEKGATKKLRKAKGHAAKIISQAEQRGVEIVDEAKRHAKQEAERIVAGARGEIDQQVHRAKEQLRNSVTELALQGAAQVLEREVDAGTHAELLAGVAARL